MTAREALRMAALAGLIAAQILWGALHAEAHTTTELDAWVDAWALEVRTEGLTLERIEAISDMRDRHPAYFAKPTPSTTTPTPKKPARSRTVTGPPADSWRSLVAAHFRPGDVELALAIIECESRGDPGAVNPTSGAAGLFQQIPKYWSERSAAAGIPGASIFDPTANTAVSAWLVYSGGGWKHWTCYPKVTR